MVGIARKKMGDGDKDNRAKCCGRERIPEAASKNSKLHENPAADEGTDQPEHDVGDASEATATRDFSRKPAGDEADQEPSDDSVPVLDDKDLRVGENGKKEKVHFASGREDAQEYAYLVYARIVSLFRRLSDSGSSRGWLLLGHTVDGSEAEDQITAGNPNDFAFWKETRQSIQSHAVVRIVKRWH